MQLRKEKSALFLVPRDTVRLREGKESLWLEKGPPPPQQFLPYSNQVAQIAGTEEGGGVFSLARALDGLQAGQLNIQTSITSSGSKSKYPWW
jgi:hypothetical protein